MLSTPQSFFLFWLQVDLSSAMSFEEGCYAQVRAIVYSVCFWDEHVFLVVSDWSGGVYLGPKGFLFSFQTKLSRGRGLWSILRFAIFSEKKKEIPLGSLKSRALCICIEKPGEKFPPVGTEQFSIPQTNRVMSSRSQRGSNVMTQMEKWYSDNSGKNEKKGVAPKVFLLSRIISREKDRSIQFPLGTTGFSTQMESTPSVAPKVILVPRAASHF